MLVGNAEKILEGGLCSLPKPFDFEQLRFLLSLVSLPFHITEHLPCGFYQTFASQG